MIKDKYDHLIEVGDIVAFNLSGGVYLGKVTDIIVKYYTTSWSLKRFTGTVSIEQNNHISKVHNLDCIVVLEKHDNS